MFERRKKQYDSGKSKKKKSIKIEKKLEHTENKKTVRIKRRSDFSIVNKKTKKVKKNFFSDFFKFY
jgi:hypothetical protein